MRQPARIAIACLACLGCNALLDNEPGVERDEVREEDVPTLPAEDAAPVCGPCVTPHATAACTSGACAVFMCDQGFADCDGLAANGCETDLGSTDSCGGCGRACPPLSHADATCVAQACVVTCEPGFADCNGARTDGCEIDVLEDRFNCGECRRFCLIGRCVSGECTL